MNDAIEIKTPECCYKALGYILGRGDSLFSLTKEWLSKGECKYPYLVFDFDQWSGSNFPELIESRDNGELYIKQLNIKQI